MNGIKVYKRGGLWRVVTASIEWYSFATWREAFDCAEESAQFLRDFKGTSA